MVGAGGGREVPAPADGRLSGGRMGWPGGSGSGLGRLSSWSAVLCGAVGALVRCALPSPCRSVGPGRGREKGGRRGYLPPLTDHHPKRSQRKRSRDGFGLRCWVLAQTKSRYKLIVATTTLASS